MSLDHPITDEDLRRALVSIAEADGGDWRGTPVAFADRLIHRFDVSHQPVTVADLVTILLFARSMLAIADSRFVALGGAVEIGIETREIDGRRTDLVVVALTGPRAGDPEALSRDETEALVDAVAALEAPGVTP